MDGKMPTLNDLQEFLERAKPSIGEPLAPGVLQAYFEEVTPLAKSFKSALHGALVTGNLDPQFMVWQHLDKVRHDFGNRQADGVALAHFFSGSTPVEDGTFHQVDFPVPYNIFGNAGLMEKVLKHFPEEPAFQLLRSGGVSREFVCPPSESEVPPVPSFQS